MEKYMQIHVIKINMAWSYLYLGKKRSIKSITSIPQIVGPIPDHCNKMNIIIMQVK